MDWMEEAAGKLRRKNQVLFSKDSAFLQDLIMLFEGQDHRVMALWAFDLAEETIARLEEKYPGETRPREALLAVQAWAAGQVKMRFAQRKILDCHAFAKDITSPEDIALCHAVGQACAVVHTAGHAIGFPIYELTAIIRRLGLENAREAVEQRKRVYAERLFYWRGKLDSWQAPWANFMLK